MYQYEYTSVDNGLEHKKKVQHKKKYGITSYEDGPQSEKRNLSPPMFESTTSSLQLPSKFIERQKQTVYLVTGSTVKNKIELIETNKESETKNDSKTENKMHELINYYSIESAEQESKEKVLKDGDTSQNIDDINLEEIFEVDSTIILSTEEIVHTSSMKNKILTLLSQANNQVQNVINNQELLVGAAAFLYVASSVYVVCFLPDFIPMLQQLGIVS
jgi:hypothetical protein